MKKVIGYILPFFLSFMMLVNIFGFLVPHHVHAEGGLFIGCNEEEIKDATGTFIGFKDPCDFNFFMLQVNKLISFLLFDLAMPLAAICFAYAGFLYMSSGGSGEQISKAKGIFKNVLFGFVIALAAWLLVKAIMLGLGFNEGEFDSFYK